jgi:hypothetical protein
MKRQVFLIALILFFAVGAGTVHALVPMPEEPGFSGNVVLGVQASKFSNNMISGTDLGDLTDGIVDDLFEEPDEEDATTGLVTGSLRYTFPSLKTQLTVGSVIADLARYEFNSVLGVRHDFGNTGIIGINALVSSLPTEVWQDPYVVGTKRDVTDRTSAGIRLDWEGIAGTNLEFRYSMRAVEVDDELSGTAQGLSQADQDLLDREGDQSTVEILYTFKLSDNDSLIPNLEYTNFDKDGDAMSGDLYILKLSYIHRTERFSIVANGSFGSSEFDEVNPVFTPTITDKREDDRVSIGLSGTYHLRPFGLEGWSIFGDLLSFNEDSNIDFYDTEITSFRVGAIYAF